MSSARSLHELLADLVGEAALAHGDLEAYLAEHGHPGLPADLVAEAVVSYADTAPVEVAAHLAPYVTAHSVVPAPPTDADEPAGSWFDLLTTAPTVEAAPDIDDLPADTALLPDTDADTDPESVLDFGTGAVDLDAPAPAAPSDGEATPPDASDDHDHPAPSEWTDLEPADPTLDLPPATDTDDDGDDTDTDPDDLG